MGPTPQEFEEREQLGARTLATAIVPEYSEQEVALHTTRKDCWVIYKDVVYDVSTFVGDHPGGPEILMQYAGTDITEVFHSVMSHDHSDAAVAMLASHKIGLLKDPQFRIGKRTKAEEVMFADDVELIDLEKPIVTQMWATNMSLEQYLRYTHTPHFLKGGRVARFFENDFMEFISKNSWHSVLLWVPVAAYFFWVGAEVYSPHASAFLFAIGVFAWTLLEYAIHRFVFHLDGYIPDHKIAICVHFLLHGVHHFLPMDRYAALPPHPPHRRRA
jgi:4-hydroxysphinganine ceramide fatty acyl 2-hydroxylase